MPVIYVYSRQGCHLCDVLIDALRPLIDGKLELVVRDIDTQAEWHEQHFMDIPVVEFDGEIVCRHVLDPAAIQGILRRCI